MNWLSPTIRQVAPSLPSETHFDADDEVWHLNLDQVESNTGRILAKYRNLASTAGTSTRVFDCGNVLYSKLRPYLNKVVLPDEPGIATTELVPLRPDPRIIQREYLTYFLRSEQFLAFATGAVAGAKMPRVIMPRFWDSKIPLPPLTEQQRISQILNEADVLRVRRSENNERLSQVVSSLFRNRFGDPSMKMRSDCPSRQKLSEVAHVSYGLSDRLDASLTADKGTRIVTISNVTIAGEIDASVERYTEADGAMIGKTGIQKYDLLFNWRNGSKEHVGKTAIWENNWPETTLHVSFLLRIRPKGDEINPYYLWALLNLLRADGFFSSQSRMQVNRKFNASELSSLRIPIPPRDQQIEFAQHLQEIRAISREQVCSHKKLEDLFCLLMYQAFSGKLTSAWRRRKRDLLEAEAIEQRRLLQTSNREPMNTIRSKSTRI